MLTFHSFMGSVDYLKPNAKDMLIWNEKYTKETCIWTIVLLELKTAIGQTLINVCITSKIFIGRTRKKQ